MTHGPADEGGDGGGDVRVTERFGAGDEVRGVVRVRVDEGPYADFGDVLGVDEPDAAVAGGRHDLVVGTDALGVDVVAGEVLHEPRRPEHGPLRELLAHGPVHRAEPGSVTVAVAVAVCGLGDRGGAEEDDAAHTQAPRRTQERKHGHRRVRGGGGRNEVDASGAGEGRGVGRGVLPVEARVLAAGGRPPGRGPPAPDAHAVAEPGQPGGDAAAGVAGAAGHQEGVVSRLHDGLLGVVVGHRYAAEDGAPVQGAAWSPVISAATRGFQ